MSKLLYLILSTLGSALGWWIGERAGLMTAFFLSLVGTAVGVYASRRIVRQYF